MKQQLSVFCDNCSCLALAQLDGNNLCAGCLMSAALSATDPAVIGKIVPLGIHPAPLRKVVAVDPMPVTACEVA